MKLRKTKGSSMLLTIAIFGILSIVGTASLGATVANYKLRIQENNRVKNLYSAESGVDMAYLDLVNTVEKAIEEGKNKAEEAKKNYKDIVEQNNIYKESYIRYLLDNLVYVDREFQVPEGSAFVSCILKEADGIDNARETITPKMAIITSSFIDDKNKERAVKVAYNIEIPGDLSNSTGSDSEGGSLVGNFTFATDGDLKLYNNTSGVNILGDLWVNGKRNSNMYNDPIKSKYDGGIDIRQSRVNFKGNVITPANIVIIGSDNLKFGDNDEGNVYAENIFLGDPSNLDNGDKATLRANDVYLSNDLVIGTSAAVAKIKNIYGFNDANLVKNGQEVRGSSSIIVNSTGWINAYDNSNNIDGYKLKVTDSAYLMGSAYINTYDGIYQTGESVALKGNYRAYTYPYMGDVLNTEFIYLDPLLLIDKDGEGEKLTIVDKADHFKYISENVDKIGTDGLYEIIKRSIISLPNKTYTAGASISENKVSASSYSLDQLEEINRQKGEFVKMAYYMGDSEYNIDQFNEGMAADGYSVLEQLNWEAIKNLPSYDNELYYYIKTSDNVHIIASEKAESISVESGRAVISGYLNYESLPKINNGDKVVIITKGKASCKWTNGVELTILAVGDIEINGCGSNLGTLDNINDEIKKASEAGNILAPILGVTVGDSSIENNDSANSLISKGKWTLVK